MAPSFPLIVIRLLLLLLPWLSSYNQTASANVPSPSSSCSSASISTIESTENVEFNFKTVFNSYPNQRLLNNLAFLLNVNVPDRWDVNVLKGSMIRGTKSLKWKSKIKSMSGDNFLKTLWWYKFRRELQAIDTKKLLYTSINTRMAAKLSSIIAYLQVVNKRFFDSFVIKRENHIDFFQAIQESIHEFLLQIRSLIEEEFKDRLLTTIENHLTFSDIDQYILIHELNGRIGRLRYLALRFSKNVHSLFPHIPKANRRQFFTLKLTHGFLNRLLIHILPSIHELAKSFANQLMDIKKDKDDAYDYYTIERFLLTAESRFKALYYRILKWGHMNQELNAIINYQELTEFERQFFMVPSHRQIEQIKLTNDFFRDHLICKYVLIKLLSPSLSSPSISSSPSPSESKLSFKYDSSSLIASRFERLNNAVLSQFIHDWDTDKNVDRIISKIMEHFFKYCYRPLDESGTTAMNVFGMTRKEMSAIIQLALNMRWWKSDLITLLAVNDGHSGGSGGQLLLDVQIEQDILDEMCKLKSSIYLLEEIISPLLLIIQILDDDDAIRRSISKYDAKLNAVSRFFRCCPERPIRLIVLQKLFSSSYHYHDNTLREFKCRLFNYEICELLEEMMPPDIYANIIPKEWDIKLLMELFRLGNREKFKNELNPVVVFSLSFTWIPFDPPQAEEVEIIDDIHHIGDNIPTFTSIPNFDFSQISNDRDIPGIILMLSKGLKLEGEGDSFYEIEHPLLVAMWAIFVEFHLHCFPTNRLIYRRLTQQLVDKPDKTQEDMLLLDFLLTPLTYITWNSIFGHGKIYEGYVELPISDRIHTLALYIFDIEVNFYENCAVSMSALTPPYGRVIHLINRLIMSIEKVYKEHLSTLMPLLHLLQALAPDNVITSSYEVLPKLVSKFIDRTSYYWLSFFSFSNVIAANQDDDNSIKDNDDDDNNDNNNRALIALTCQDRPIRLDVPDKLLSSQTSFDERSVILEQNVLKPLLSMNQYPKPCLLTWFIKVENSLVIDHQGPSRQVIEMIVEYLRIRKVFLETPVGFIPNLEYDPIQCGRLLAVLISWSLRCLIRPPLYVSKLVHDFLFSPPLQPYIDDLIQIAYLDSPLRGYLQMLQLEKDMAGADSLSLSSLIPMHSIINSSSTDTTPTYQFTMMDYLKALKVKVIEFDKVGLELTPNYAFHTFKSSMQEELRWRIRMFRLSFLENFAIDMVPDCSRSFLFDNRQFYWDMLSVRPFTIERVVAKLKLKNNSNPLDNSNNNNWHQEISAPDGTIGLLACMTYFLRHEITQQSTLDQLLMIVSNSSMPTMGESPSIIISPLSSSPSPFNVVVAPDDESSTSSSGTISPNNATDGGGGNGSDDPDYFDYTGFFSRDGSDIDSLSVGHHASSNSSTEEESGGGGGGNSNGYINLNSNENSDDNVFPLPYRFIDVNTCTRTLIIPQVRDYDHFRQEMLSLLESFQYKLEYNTY